MEFVRHVIDIFLHLNNYLNAWAGWMGGWLYLLLFVVVFCETGLVVTPFLPGDSLLFAVGALAATEGSPINLVLVILILFVAGVLGDATNYTIGRRFGDRLFKSETSKIFNKKYLIRTHAFYERHGGKTIILARFMPIIRTFAPFVAGMGKMTYTRFAAYNIVGAAVWVVSFTVLGYRFGLVKVVQKNFQLVILAIIVLSVMPAVVEFTRAFLRSRAEKKAAAEKAASGPVAKSETPADAG